MSSAFRRRYQKELQQAREAAVHRRTELVSQLGEDRREDAWLLIQGKHAELHGSGFYSIGQIEEVNAIIAAYTPDEFDAAVALAKSRESVVQPAGERWSGCLMLGEHEMRDIDERREQIMNHQPKCPSCSSDQVQNICTQVPAVWRCRVCRRGFESEPTEQ